MEKVKMVSPKIMSITINEEDRKKKNLLEKTTMKLTGKDVNLKKMEDRLNKIFDEIERYDSYIEKIKSMIVKGDSDYLDRVHHNVTRWKIDYTLIDYYIEEVKGYIAGFKERFSHLKIDKTLKKIKLLNQITKYKEELAYFKKLHYMVIKGEKQGDWKDFEIFYKKLKKEVKEVEQGFGDETSARELEKGERKFREYPRAWRELLTKTRSRLEDQRYAELLISRVQKALIQIMDYIKRENKKSINKKLGFFDEEVTRLKSEFMDILMKINEKYPKLTSSTVELVKVFERMDKYDAWIAKALEHMTSNEMEEYLLNKMGFFPEDYTKKIQRVQNAKLDVIKKEMQTSKKVLKDKGRAIPLYKEALRTAELLLEKQRKLYEKIFHLAKKRGIVLRTREEKIAA